MKVKDTEFAYAVAKIRARQAHMLDYAKLMRMADAADFSEAVKILRESGYTGETPEAMLEGEIEKTYALLQEISPAKEIFSVFLVKNDYHNIKVLLKAEFLGKNFDYLLRSRGRYSPERLKNIIAGRLLGELTDIMQAAVTEAADALTKTGDPQLSDLILDKAAYREMSALCKELDSPFVSELVAVMIDLANLRILVRVQKMGKNLDFLLRALIPGGTLAPEGLAKSLQKPAAEVIRNTAYRALADSASDMAAFEKAADNYLTAFVQKARYVTFGVEPLVAFLLAKENEVRQVRIILTGKKNGLDAGIIKERLRDFHV